MTYLIQILSFCSSQNPSMEKSNNYTIYVVVYFFLYKPYQANPFYMAEVKIQWITQTNQFKNIIQFYIFWNRYIINLLSMFYLKLTSSHRGT